MDNPASDYNRAVEKVKSKVKVKSTAGARGTRFDVSERKDEDTARESIRHVRIIRKLSTSSIGR